MKALEMLLIRPHDSCYPVKLKTTLNMKVLRGCLKVTKILQVITYAVKLFQMIGAQYGKACQARSVLM
jgi:hypothetical protein